MHKEYYSLAIAASCFGLIIISIMEMKTKQIKVWYNQSNRPFFLLSWVTVSLLWFYVSFFIIMVNIGGEKDWVNSNVFQDIGGVLGPFNNSGKFIIILFERLIHPINIDFIIKLS